MGTGGGGEQGLTGMATWEFSGNILYLDSTVCICRNPADTHLRFMHFTVR